MAAPDAQLGQHVQHVVERAESAGRRRRRLAESTKVESDDVAFGCECRPQQVPHPTIGDARMDEDERQVTGRTRPVVGQASR